MTEPNKSVAPSIASDDVLVGSYNGSRHTLLGLAVKTSFLTLITLGVYRFWERTRIRRYIWSAIAPGGEPFEYTGTGLEKLLGFLVAVVILAVTLGTIQLGLAFFNLSYFQIGDDPQAQAIALAAFNASLLILLPLRYFAQYRGRRYWLSRTRWRGIRFGMEGGAWGYAGRACGFLFLTVITLGVLLPLMTFKLEKYMTDRTFFGGERMHQGGRWQMLYPATKHIAIGIGLYALGIVLLVKELVGVGVASIILGSIWGMVGFIYYGAKSFQILTSHKSLGSEVELGCDVSGGKIVRITLGGGFVVVLLGIITSAVAVGLMALFGVPQMMAEVPETGVIAPNLFQSAVSVIGTLLSLMMYAVLYLIYVQQPVLAHKAEHTWVKNPIALTSIKQRMGDDFADADGFADALDVGGAF